VGILAGILLPKLGSARKEAAEATKKNELQKRLGDLHNRIIDADSFFYIPADNILAKLREVEDALEQLERIAVDQGDHALDIWKMLGKGWHFLGTLDRAEHVLRKAHQRAPNDDRVNFYLGRVYLQQSWLAGLTGGPISEEARRKQEKSLAEKALVHLRKLSSAKGRMGEIDHHLARAYEAFSARRKEEARRLCEEGQKLFNTKMGREEYQIILAMLATGQDRISACQEALSVRHHFPWASFIRGAERLEREEWTIANGDFDSALRIWKHFVPARINRAYALFRSGNHTAATKECYEASLVKRSSDQDDLLYNVWGSAQHALSKYQDALTSFDKALKANPKLVEAQYNIGQVKHSLGKLDDAIEDFKKAVDIERRYTDSHWKIGNIYLHRGEFAKAVDWFTHGVDQTDAMRKQHPLEHFYCNRGLASAKLGHSKEAISDWSAAIRTNPECAEAYVNRLQARLATQQSEHLDAEVADCTEALNGKGRRFALICRAHARAHKREYGPAIADFREGLKLIADDVSIVAMAYFTYVAYYNLACCYARVDQSDNAFTGLRRAIELGFKDVKQLSEELDLQSLRADPRWQGVLDLLGK
jgi:tetratricopeptide (TPR) repeat protein